MKHPCLRKRFIRYACISFGNLLLAFGVTAFAIPHSLALTGVNGIARNLNHFLGLDMTLAIFTINLVAFFTGYVCLGRDFAFNTILSTILYPVVFRTLSLLPNLGALTSNRLLAAILAGIFFGLGIGLVMKVGGSTGGMDIPPLILNKKFRVPVVISMYGIEGVSLTIQLTYSSGEQILYGVISTLVSGAVINQVLLYDSRKLSAISGRKIGYKCSK